MKINTGCLTPRSTVLVFPMLEKCTWKPIPIIGNSPSQRSLHTVCFCDHYLYMYGGRSHRGSEHDLWSYDLLLGLWEKINYTGDKPPALEGHSLLEFRGKLYMFGGELSFASAGETPLWCFDPSCASWEKVSCKSSNQVPLGRKDHISFIYKNEMYIHGGYVDLKGSVQEFWKFNFDSKKWVHLDDALTEPCPSGRYKHAGVIKNDTLWICGGLMGVTDKNLNQTWTWNFITRIWCCIKSKGKPNQLFSHDVAIVNNDIFVFGGKRENGMSCSKLWKISNAIQPTNIWTTCTLNSHLEPSNTSNHSLVLVPYPITIVKNSNMNVSTNDLKEQNTPNESMKTNVIHSKSDNFTLFNKKSHVQLGNTEDVFLEKEELSEKNPLVKIKSADSSLYTATNPLMLYNTNTDVVDSTNSNIYRVNAVSHYSYNLSSFQQSWTTIKRTDVEDNDHETTSFIELPEKAKPELTVKNQTFAEDSIKTLYKNADVLNNLNSKLDSLETNNLFNTTNDFSNSSLEFKLLLVGGNINESNFHKKESLHMWECDLKYN